MSGSYDRPPGRPGSLPPPANPRGRPVDQPYSQPVTGPPSAVPGGGHGRQWSEPQSQPLSRGSYRGEDSEPREADPGFDRHSPPDRGDFDDELKAEGRGGSAAAKKPKPQSTGVVPAGSVTSRSLTLVVAIMCFLACLTAGGVYMVNQSASAWLKDIASEVTVQIEPRERVDMDKNVKDAAAFLARQPGIRSVRPLSHDESAALVEPWLGKSDALKSLPIPRLIALEVDQSQPPDLEQLQARLGTEFKNATLDDHRHWQAQIRTVTRSLALGGLAILMLVGAATTAIIISATRSSMASNREIIEVLHLVGATDRYIAREFDRHFLRLGIRAGLVGAVFAMLVFMVMPMAMEMLGGNVVTIAEMRRLFGAGVLDLPGYLVLVVVVVVIAALCMLTSRFGVYRILDTHR